MATQAKLPHTLPTPAQARSSLRLARQLKQERFLAAEGYKDHVAASKDEVTAATKEVEEAEVDLLEAKEGSQEDADASARHAKAWRRKWKAESDLEKVLVARKLAVRELKEAERALAAAREDIEAIRQGRRKP